MKVDCTEKAVELFGDIVKCAYSNTKYLERVGIAKEGISIISTSIIVEFTNGKQVEIWTSEWGGIHKLGFYAGG
jgi:hypothetical protein